MLKKLRYKLTILYLTAAVLLALAVGAGSYTLVDYYFRSTTDDALRVKVGLELAALNIPLPMDLYTAVRKAGLVITLPIQEYNNDEGNVSEEKKEGLQLFELSDIYVFPLSLEGTLPNGYSSYVNSSRIDTEAVQQAIIHGYDFRTVRFEDGISARILTYLVPGNYPIKVFQAGRYLTLQGIVLRQLLNTMMILGGVVTLLIGMVAWLMAGRTIKPTQQAWDKQQVFVANASHELRAPLTLIHAGIEVALRDSKSESQKQVLTDVLSDSDYMGRLIGELLLLSRLDAKAIEFDIQSISINDFLVKIIRQLEVSALNNEIILKSHISDIKLCADPLRLEQIILIVVDNAIQHTPKGGEIFISVRAMGKCAQLLITDTGPGIARQHLPHVFERFYKISHKSNSESSGSGLGLSIAKSLVDEQKGSIKIYNKSPHGTEVEILFPLSR